ncbi:MAG: septation protein SpoVG family protein [Oscillospiraceae bacterium]
MADYTKAPADPEAQAKRDAEAYLLYEAPIAELAGARGVSIDEAVKERVAAAIEAAPMKMEVAVRPIEPRGKLIGFASVSFGGVMVEDFKIFDGEKGLFVGMPSKADPGSRSGYHNTTRITDRGLQERLNEAAAGAYSAEVDKLQARAAAVRAAPERKAPIKEQMAEAAKAAEKGNAEHKAPAKGKEARDAR